MNLWLPGCVWLIAATSLASADEAVSSATVFANGRMSIVARLGPRQVLLRDQQHGLRYFPDGAIAVVRMTPACRILMAAGVSSYLLEGRDLRSLAAVAQVLAPGPKGSFDNGYAGISAAVREPASGELLAFYHAEDQEQMPRLGNGVPGFYCCVALAVSKDEGRTFTKAGPVITNPLPKDLGGRPDQGCGEVCVTPDKAGDHLLAYYTDHSRTNGRGVQICMARCPRRDKGRPGAWAKFHGGAFSQPGLGGKDTPVVSAREMNADAIMPHVTYVPALAKYVMVFNINAYAELEREKPQHSGIYAAFSDDGLTWSRPARLLTSYAVPIIGRELAWHPALVWSEAGAGSLDGWLCYSYSESWGHKSPHTPHYLVGRQIRFTIEQ